MTRRSTQAGALVVAAAMLLAGLTSPAAAYPRPGQTERGSVASGGGQSNGPSRSAALSADGRYVAFASDGENVVEQDANRVRDVFVRDRQTGATERVSVASDGAEGNGGSDSPSLSGDGRFVAFSSDASNLVQGDTNGVRDVFVHDRQTGTTERVSVASDGTQGTQGSNQASFSRPAISADGRFVAFASFASNLVPVDTNGVEDVFVRDRQTGVTGRVSVASDGAEGNGGSGSPSLSGDGRFVAFSSDALNLIVGDANRAADVFVHDRESGVTERVSVDSDGAQADGPSYVPSINADGRYVAFSSAASNLVPGDTNHAQPLEAASDVFVHDRETGETERVSVASDGAEANALSAGTAGISGDGRIVAFASNASNLVAGDINGTTDVFVHDRQARVTERVSVAADVTEGNAASALIGLSLSGDGRLVAFESKASNLVAGDTNGYPDVFVRDRGLPIGVGDLTADIENEQAVASGWATFTAATLSSATDTTGDGLGSEGAAAAGADLTEASAIYRPEQEDLLARLRVTAMPGSLPNCSIPFTCPAIPGGVGSRKPGQGPNATAVYGVEFTVAGNSYEIRAFQTLAPPLLQPTFGLYRCEAACTQVADLTGGIGTTGTEVLISLPKSALHIPDGAAVTDIEAFTAVRDTDDGPLMRLDELTLDDAEIPVTSVRVGIAGAGIREDGVEFTTTADLAEGVFSASLPAASLPSGDYEVWARACLGEVCHAATTGPGPEPTPTPTPTPTQEPTPTPTPTQEPTPTPTPTPSESPAPDREVPPGTLLTVAGGFGEGAKATEVAIDRPGLLEVGPGGDLYLTFRDIGAVLRVDAGTGELSLAAGSGFSSGSDGWGYAPMVGGDGGPATQARIGWPAGVAFDRDGNMFIADQKGMQVRRVDADTGIITTIAGDGPHWNVGSSQARAKCQRSAGWPAPGDGGPATKVCLRAPSDVAVAADGSVYVSESDAGRVRKVHPDGTITTVAGIGGALSCGGDGGPATEACLNPGSVAVDAAGNLFIVSGNRVRRVDADSGVITTVAGSGEDGFCGDGGQATDACLGPADVAFDAAGNLFISDGSNHRVRRVDADTGVITTVVGSGEPTPLEPSELEVYSDNGDGGQATQATLNAASGLAVDSDGVLYVGDRFSNRVRRVDPDTGVITTIAGNGARYFSGDGGPATQAVLGAATDGAVDAAGNFYFVDQYHHRVRKIDAATGVISTVAGKAVWGDQVRDPDEQAEAIADQHSSHKQATEVHLGVPTGVDVDDAGNLYIATRGYAQAAGAWGHLVRKVDAQTGTITTIAGTGDRGYAGDGGPARLARLDMPQAVDVDSAGNVFIADWGSCHVRRVDATTGVITTVAGLAAGVGVAGSSDATFCGYAGDGGPATLAKLSHVSDVAVDADGNVYIADSGQWFGDISPSDPHRNQVVRRVDAATGVITTIAGVPRTVGGSGDGGPADEATFFWPGKIAVDAAGDLFIADYWNHRVRKVDADTGVITTVAGVAKHPGDVVFGFGEWAYRGDGGPATQTPIGNPNGVAVSPQGDLFITDNGYVGYTWNTRWNPDRIHKVVGVAAPTTDPTPTPTPTATQSPAPDTTDVSFTDRSQTSAQYSDETLFEARLTDSGGDPIEGAELAFELTGAESSRAFTATTDEDGIASVTPTLSEKSGPYQLTVRYDGDDDHEPSADTASFVVDKEDTALELTERKGKDKALVARLYDADTPADGIAGRTIDFYAGADLLGSATTDDDGVATFEPPKQKGKKQPYEARFDGDDFYLGSSDQGTGKGGKGGKGGNGAGG